MNKATSPTSHHPLYSPPTEDSMYIDVNTRIQILETIGDLPRAHKDQCGAFIVSLLPLLLP